MDRELFIEIINYIIAQEEREFKLTEALKEYGGDDFMRFGTDINAHLVDWLERIMKDKPDSKFGSYISWWLWDAPNRGKAKKSNRTVIDTNTGKKYDLKTAGDLYDCLTENSHGK